MFPSTDVKSGTECALRRKQESELAAREPQIAQRVRELSGKFAHERTSCEQSELEALVTSSTAARRAYIKAILLHADLTSFFKWSSRNHDHESI
jgi:hypothetical protein